MVEEIIMKDEGAVVLMDRVRRKSRGRVLREIFFNPSKYKQEGF